MHDAGDGKLFAFCRTRQPLDAGLGGRENEDGVEREELERCVEEAGFTLGPVAHLLRD